MNAEPILRFLQDLKRHNDREWFQSQSERYAEARASFVDFVGTLLDKLGEDEPAWATLDPAKCVFRIHRDLRFSKDKTPYKTNFSAQIAGEGKVTNSPGLYLSIEPGGQSMVAGGLYQPTPAELHQIRSRIAADPDEFRSLFASRQFRQHFPDGLNGDRSKVVRGFAADHPAFHLLQVKSHIAFRMLSDEDVLAKDYAKRVIGSFRALIPLCRWLAEARLDPAGRRPAVVLSERERRNLRR